MQTKFAAKACKNVMLLLLSSLSYAMIPLFSIFPIPEQISGCDSLNKRYSGHIPLSKAKKQLHHSGDSPIKSPYDPLQVLAAGQRPFTIARHLISFRYLIR